MNAPEGWRRPAPRQADPGAETFPGDAGPAQEDDVAGAAETPASGEATEDGRSGRRGRRRGRGRSPEGPTPGSPAAQGPPADPEAVAREICLRQLSFSPKTRAQLADALRRKGVPDDVAERVLSRYSEVGLIDDAAFARAWVESRHVGRGLARRALAAELRRRGVADETVSEAVEELGPEQEEAAARELVARRLPGTRNLDPVKRTRRLMGMLARKGYSGGLAYRVVREALEAEGAGELPDLSFDD
ncbi:regulatory protein RecX [Actinoallomurus spadix]|uniref:regulatory protein RecX n=1 Tax=Actinoallomurus spadix TaxID=79912 RepID=UPI0027E278D2|nr:regulatory protein RecX [Actinoallomurus spadix]